MEKGVSALHIAAVLIGFVICNLKLCFYFNVTVPEARDSSQTFRHNCLKLKREVLAVSRLNLL